MRRAKDRDEAQDLPNRVKTILAFIPFVQGLAGFGMVILLMIFECSRFASLFGGIFLLTFIVMAVAWLAIWVYYIVSKHSILNWNIWRPLFSTVIVGAIVFFFTYGTGSHCGQFLPRKCQLGMGIVCIDHQILENGQSTLVLNNGLGRDIKILGLNFSSVNELCDLINTTNPTVLRNGEEIMVNIGTERGCSDSTGHAQTGTRIKGKLTLKYKDLISDQDHVMEGTLLTDVE